MAPSNRALLNSRQAFAYSTLQDLNVPVTQENANALLAQFEAEEPAGTSAPYNPGNIEVNTARSFGFNDVGSWDIAPQIATFRTFGEGVKAYSVALQRIAPQAVVDMKRQASATQIAQDIGSSGWGTNTSTMESILASGSERGSAAKSSVTGGATTGQNTLTGGYSPGQSADSLIPGLPSGVSGVLGGFASGLVGGFTSLENFGLRAGKVLLGILLLVAIAFIAIKT